MNIEIYKEKKLPNEAKLDMLFGDRISVEAFYNMVRNARKFIFDEYLLDISTIGNYNSHHISISSNDLENKAKDTAMDFSISASFFDPCKTYDFCSWGYSINMYLRGSRQGVKRDLDKTIELFGFPKDVTPPSKLSGIYLLLEKSPTPMTNKAGWDIAKEVIKKQGASLKKVNYSICRFPFNILIRDSEGKIMDDKLKVINDDLFHIFVKKYYVTD